MDERSAACAGQEVHDHLRSELDALLDYQSGCWARGERPGVEACLERRPGLRENPNAVLDLICHEILLRTRLGESPDAEEYLRRFPQVAEQLGDHFEVFEAIDRLGPRDSLLGRSPETTPRWAGADERAASASQRKTTTPQRATTTGAAPPVISGYELLGEVGRGAMGVVYKARRLGLSRLTALKILRPSAAGPREAARFRAEAEALGRLEHPNIVRIYEVGECEGRPFVALEFVDGGSLEQKLRGAPQPARAAAALAETLARAVHEAHHSGVVHRDLKPANVLLTAGGAPKITDFGLAKRLDGDAAQTRTGEILGTPSYMAPEQARGKSDAVGTAADVYALGAILYEMLTGRPPFRGETVWDTMEQVVGREPTPPRQLAPRVPRDLETICLKCLQKEPARRYASAAELADDLRRFLNGETVRARPTSAPERVWKWVRRRPATTATIAASAALTVLLAAAHYADLRVKLAEAERAGAVSDVRAQLEGVRTQVNAARWSEAAARLREQTEPRLRRARQAFPADAALAALAADADRLQEQIDSRLTDEARLRRFRELRGDVEFWVTPFSGLDDEACGPRIREAACEALSLFGISADSGGAAPDAAGFPEAEQTEVRQGCCELLLAMAGTELAGAGDARALALLDRAARLGAAAPQMAAVRSRRGGAEAPDLAAPLAQPFEWFLRGNDLCQAARWAGAIDAFEKALSLQPIYPTAHYALAVCYLKAPAPAEIRKANVLLAQEHLSACIEQGPARVWPHLQRALVDGELKEFDAAEADFAAAERLLRDSPDGTARYALHVNRGVTRIQRDDAEGAVEDLQLAVTLAPDEPAAYADLAMAYQKQRRLDEAVTQLDLAIARTPLAGLSALYRDRARLDQDRGDAEAAVRDLDEAVRRDAGGAASPATADDRLLQGRLLDKLGRWEEALAAADASLAARSNWPDALRLRAEALLRLNRYAVAVESLGRCVAAEQKAGRSPDPAVHLARAQACAAADDPAAAAEDYTRYLGIRPGDASALAARGWAYAALDAPALALRDFDAAIRLDPNDGDAYNGRAYALARTGRPQEAVRDAEEALRRGPPGPRLFYNAARVFGRTAQTPAADPRERIRCEDRALDLLRQALEALPEPDRPAFWRRNVARDAAMDSVRGDGEFRRLAVNCGAPD